MIFASFSTSCIALQKKVRKQINIPPKIVFMGDSIAAGYGLDGYDRNDLYKCNSYANILGQEYSSDLDDEFKPTMINCAVSGDKSSHLLEHLKKGEFDNAINQSNAVVISIGGNDILQLLLFAITDCFNVKKGTHINSLEISASNLIKFAIEFSELESKVDKALKEYTENLNEIISYIHNKTSGVIIVQTLYNPLDGIKKMDKVSGYVGKQIDKLNDVIKGNAKTSKGEQYTVCDVAKSFEDKGAEYTNITHMDIHPNAEGHRVISKCLDKTIRSKTYTVYKEVTADTKTTADNSTAAKIYLICILTFAVIIIIKRFERK